MRYLIEGDTPSAAVFLPSARDLPWVRSLLAYYGAIPDECDVERAKDGRLRMYIKFHGVSVTEEGERERAMPGMLQSIAELLQILRSEGVGIDPAVFTADEEEESGYNWYSLDLDDEDLEPVLLTPEQIVEAVRAERGEK